MTLKVTLDTPVLDHALVELHKLVADGTDYAEAHARVATAFQLTDLQAERLIDAYDDTLPYRC